LSPLSLHDALPISRVLGLAPEPPGAPDVEHEPVVAVLGGPARLPAPGELVKRLDRDSGTAADVLDVDERRAPPLRLDVGHEPTTLLQAEVQSGHGPCGRPRR